MFGPKDAPPEVGRAIARRIAEAAHRDEGCPCAGDIDRCEYIHALDLAAPAERRAS